MRRLLNSNPHKLGPFLASPFLAIGVLLLVVQGTDNLLPALGLLTLGGIIYASVAIVGYVDKALVERHHGRR
jgi:hypothetical protein